MADNQQMEQPDFVRSLGFDDHRGQRRHRFMESADINAAFRELFQPLRANVRRGNSNHGQVYAIEMDLCIPGELLGTEWIPPASRGVTHSRELADPARRQALYAQLFAEKRPHQMLAYVGERRSSSAMPAHLYLELVTEDACWAARFALLDGRGWHRRELLAAGHVRVGPLALV